MKEARPAFFALLSLSTLSGTWAAGDFCNPEVKSIFRYSDKVLEDIVPVSLLFLIMILITLFLKFVFEKLEKAAHHYDHCKAILEETVKELMLLGMISFTVFVLKDSKFLCLLPQRYFVLEEIEIVHVFLFFVGVIYIILAVLLLLVFRLTGTRWKDFESQSDDQVAVAAEYFLFTQRWYYFLNPFYLKSYWYTSSLLNFRIIRKNFIAYNDLPQTFDFARYLRKCLRRNVVHLLEIHWTIWAVFLLLISCNTLRYLVEVYLHEGSFPDGRGGESHFSIVAAGMDITLILVCMKCSFIEHKLTSKMSSESYTFGGHKFIKLDEYDHKEHERRMPSKEETKSVIFQKELTAAYFLQEAEQQRNSSSTDSVSDIEVKVEKEKIMSMRRVQRESLVRVAPLFFWGRPGLMFRVIQLITFYSSCHVVLFVMFLGESIQADHDGFLLTFTVYGLYVAPCVLAFVIILGFTLPRYVLISSINDLTKKELLQHMLTKQILKEFKRNKKKAEGDPNLQLALDLAGKLVFTKHEDDDDIDQDIRVRKKKHH